MSSSMGLRLTRSRGSRTSRLPSCPCLFQISTNLSPCFHPCFNRSLSKLKYKFSQFEVSVLEEADYILPTYTSHCNSPFLDHLLFGSDSVATLLYRSAYCQVPWEQIGRASCRERV